MGKWINTQKYLPHLGDYSVLAYFGELGTIDMVHVEDYFKDMWNGLDGNGSAKYTQGYIRAGITHWMPLPEPPK